ncbi:MAG: hypothetical protein QGH83_13790 [Candidatus Pacebacteria bacterium]|jgi:hypothetical protein|nr:hypothetical protein [Candidatus Paceibacterota bacterium]
MARDITARLRTVGQLLTGTGATTVYTCPANFETEVKLLYVNNLHSGAVDLTIKVVLSSTDTPIVTTYSMAADDILDVFNSGPIAMQAADTIVVTAGTASKLNVVVTVSESFVG